MRGNTPSVAIFALDPYYMHITGEDEMGFALSPSEADWPMLPLTAVRSACFLHWRKSGLRNYGPRRVGASLERNFRLLQAKYGLGWVVLQQSQIVDLQCPYQNRAVKVCKVD